MRIPDAVKAIEEIFIVGEPSSLNQRSKVLEILEEVWLEAYEEGSNKIFGEVK